jgi:hypothetical protein
MLRTRLEEPEDNEAAIRHIESVVTEYANHMTVRRRDDGIVRIMGNRFYFEASPVVTRRLFRAMIDCGLLARESTPTILGRTRYLIPPRHRITHAS